MTKSLADTDEGNNQETEILNHESRIMNYESGMTDIPIFIIHDS
jgi:hypothetical protein